MKLKAELSKKNKYWISKHRYYELVHFCLQYPEWVKRYSELGYGETSKVIALSNEYGSTDRVADIAVERAICMSKIELVEKTCRDTDLYISDYILRGVTEDLSYTYLSTVLNIPCGQDMYYDRRRKFFWMLSKRMP